MSKFRSTRGRSSWADEEADTEKPHAGTQSRREEDATQDRSLKMGWLRNLGGRSGAASKGKNNRSPPRGRQEPLSAHHSPSPHSPHSYDDSHVRPAPSAGAAVLSGGAAVLGSVGKHLHLPMPNFHGTPDPTLVAELDELRKEVKGLQEAFVSLKREHKELRGEISSHRAADKVASLPVDSAVDPNKGKQASKGAGKGPFGAGVGDMESMGIQNSKEPQMRMPPQGYVDAGFQDESTNGLWNELFNCWGTNDAKEKANETAPATYTQLGAGAQQSAASVAVQGTSSVQPSQPFQHQQQQQQDLRNAAAWTQPLPPMVIGGATGSSHTPASMAMGTALAGSASADAVDTSSTNARRAPPPREPLMDAERRHNTRSESAGPVMSTASASSDTPAYTPGFGREGRSPSPVPPQVRPLPLSNFGGGNTLVRHANDTDAAYSDEIAATSPWNSPRDAMRPGMSGSGVAAIGSHAMSTVTDQGDSNLRLGRGLSGDSEEAPNFGLRAGSSGASAQARAAAGTQPSNMRRPPLSLLPQGDDTAGSAPWRAPQAGEPLVLPFPDLDDDAGLPPMAVPPPLAASGSGMAKAVSLQSGPPAETEPLAGKLVFTGSPRLQSPRQ